MSSDKKKKQIETTFNSVAERYDTNKFFTISANILVEQLNLDASKRMLDVSTGTGVIAITAAKKCPGMEIEAVDISMGMLNQAKKKSERLKINNIKFAQMDVENINYPDTSFDIITCGYGLFFYPEMEETFKKIYDKIKKGGQFVFSTFTKEAFQPYTDVFRALLKEYDVESPEMSRTRLQNEEQIRTLCSFTSDTNSVVNIIKREIRYKITVNDWWSLVNSAAYKGLLDQVKPAMLDEFRDRHLKNINQLSENGKITLNADSLYVIISK